MKWIDSIKSWMTSWFTEGRRAQVVAVLDHVSAFVDVALPVVEAIDRELKPGIRAGAEPRVCVIERFLVGQCPGSESAARTAAGRICYMPLPDLCVNAALFVLKHRKSDSVGLSILRLAIELAYNVYKSSKKQ